MLVGLIVDGESTGSLTVTLEWAIVVVIFYVVRAGGTPALRDLADLVRAFFGG